MKGKIVVQYKSLARLNISRIIKQLAEEGMFS